MANEKEPPIRLESPRLTSCDVCNMPNIAVLLAGLLRDWPMQQISGGWDQSFYSEGCRPGVAALAIWGDNLGSLRELRIPRIQLDAASVLALCAATKLEHLSIATGRSVSPGDVRKLLGSLPALRAAAVFSPQEFKEEPCDEKSSAPLLLSQLCSLELCVYSDAMFAGITAPKLRRVVLGHGEALYCRPVLRRMPELLMRVPELDLRCKDISWFLDWCEQVGMETRADGKQAQPSGGGSNAATAADALPFRSLALHPGYPGLPALRLAAILGRIPHLISLALRSAAELMLVASLQPALRDRLTTVCYPGPTSLGDIVSLVTLFPRLQAIHITGLGSGFSPQSLFVCRVVAASLPQLAQRTLWLHLRTLYDKSQGLPLPSVVPLGRSHAPAEKCQVHFDVAVASCEPLDRTVSLPPHM